MGSQRQQKILAVLPARYASTRFPGKVIAPLAGRPLVWHTYNQTRKSLLITDTVIATDDDRVVNALAPFSIPTVMTRSDHISGTDRIAEVASNSDAALIVNVQADEPLIDPHTIDSTIQALLDDPGAMMSTAKRRITEPEDITSPHVVKVVCDGLCRALYFSRSPIPHIRDAEDRHFATTAYWQHIGLYVFRRDFLLRYARLAPTPLEKLEKLEQLRVLENGFPIAVVETGYRSIGVDTPDDLERVSAMLHHSQESSS